MSTKIANTVFSGDASEDLLTTDAYLTNQAAKIRLEQAIKSGALDKELGVPELTPTAGDAPTNPNSDDQDAKEEKAGLSAVVAKVGDLALQKYDQAAAIVKGQLGKPDDDRPMAERVDAATRDLGAMLPTQLSSACSRIVDRFKNMIFGPGNAYDVVGSGGSHKVRSDAVQCALDAFKALASITGLKGELKSSIVDIEASSQVLGGMLSVLVEYGMKEDIETVLNTTNSDNVKYRAIGLASKVIGQTGDLTMMNWMFDKIGVNGVQQYIPNLTSFIGNYYDKKATGNKSEDYFFGTLSRVDPYWDKKGELYYFDVFGGGSPDAINAFYTHDAYRAIAMTKDITYFDHQTVRDPSTLEVVNDLYPKAVGPSRYLPTSDIA